MKYVFYRKNEKAKEITEQEYNELRNIWFLQYPQNNWWVLRIEEDER